jgi:hypothetical protein
VNTGDPNEFALWLQRANDPSVSEQERRECRTLMDGYLQARMREAFRIAAAGGGSPIKQDPPGD